MWLVYEIVLSIGLLVYVPSALWRKRLPHRGWTMRLGRYPARVHASLQGRRSLWIHAVSVGEVLACRPLVRELARRYPGDAVVLSTITPSGYAVASEQLSDCAVPVYFPLDLRWCASRAMEALRPRAVLLMESELWPVMIRMAHARGIPVLLINGRISPRAFRRYRWVRPWLRRLARHLALFLTQSQADADRLLALGVPPEKVRVMGNLKWEASLAHRPAARAVEALASRLGLACEEALIVAGSTHRGEEASLLEAFRKLREGAPALRLIIAPRHLERVAEVEALIRRAGWTLIRCTQVGARPGEGHAGAGWDVAIVDTFGQLPDYYSLATVAFVGGSLIPHGGQNPLEPASLGTPVVFGPSMHNFAQITQQLLAHRAARQLPGRAALLPALRELLTDRAEAQAMGRRAQALTEQSQGAGRRALEALEPFLK